jgi:hypothetical protein
MKLRTTERLDFFQNEAIYENKNTSLLRQLDHESAQARGVGVSGT